jgi:hypothetical protein
LQPAALLNDSAVSKQLFLVLLTTSVKIPVQEKTRIENWLKVRLQQDNIQLIFQQ